VIGDQKIAGYSSWDFYLLLFTGQIGAALFFAFVQKSSNAVREQVLKGDLDYFLIKPAPSWFLISFQDINFRVFVSIFGYLIFGLPWIVIAGNYHFDVWQWINIALILVFSFVLSFTVRWLVTLLSFFWDRFDAGIFFIESLENVSYYPKSIYPESLQVIFIYFLPMALINAPIFQVIDGSWNISLLIEMIGVMVIFILLLKIMWGFSLKKYGSAG
jgi:ABC-2 type transport system permease protein